MTEQEQQLLLEIADDELILGWRDSEWTGIAPLLEEDVAFSSIAQNEIGHARALYELVARERGTTADELAFDRSPDEYRCAPIVELRLLDWAHTIARHYLYEEADAIRLERLKQSDDPEIAGLAAKIDREEAYHRMHAQMWSRTPAATSPASPGRRWRSFGRSLRRSSTRGRGGHTPELRELWEEMTMVRRSQPAGHEVVTEARSGTRSPRSRIRRSLSSRSSTSASCATSTSTTDASASSSRRRSSAALRSR